MECTKWLCFNTPFSGIHNFCVQTSPKGYIICPKLSEVLSFYFLHELNHTLSFPVNCKWVRFWKLILKDSNFSSMEIISINFSVQPSVKLMPIRDFFPNDLFLQLMESQSFELWIVANSLRIYQFVSKAN